MEVGSVARGGRDAFESSVGAATDECPEERLPIQRSVPSFGSFSGSLPLSLLLSVLRNCRSLQPPARGVQNDVQIQLSVTLHPGETESPNPTPPKLRTARCAKEALKPLYDPAAMAASVRAPVRACLGLSPSTFIHDECAVLIEDTIIRKP